MRQKTICSVGVFFCVIHLSGCFVKNIFLRVARIKPQRKKLSWAPLKNQSCILFMENGWLLKAPPYLCIRILFLHCISTTFLSPPTPPKAALQNMEVRLRYATCFVFFKFAWPPKASKRSLFQVLKHHLEFWWTPLLMQGEEATWFP